jgi:hypothetical protein
LKRLRTIVTGCIMLSKAVSVLIVRLPDAALSLRDGLV